MFMYHGEVSARPAIQLQSELAQCSSTPQQKLENLLQSSKVNRRLAQELDTPDGDTPSDDGVKKKRTSRNEVRHTIVVQDRAESALE